VTLEGRGIVITGANQGLGRQIAEQCVRNGADVVICARNAALLESAVEDLKALAAPAQTVASVTADVSRPVEVVALIDFAAKKLPHLTGLVNNAGIYGPMGLIEEIDWEEWTTAIHINLMGTVLPCRSVLPLFRKAGYGKIVNLSGGGATAPMPRISAYAASKAAVVRFTETLAEEVKDAHIDVNAIAPGALNTRLLQEVLEAGPERVGQEFYDRATKQKQQGGAPLSKGAELVAFLMSAASDGITGRLLSALWDPWCDLQERWPAIANTDVYTLRRIVPKDRGLDWE
jgi:NAD(P)-dependent dehydrogenase (short-subunit alcohol dehydrogenase family)